MFSEELLLDDVARTINPDFFVSNITMAAIVGVTILIAMIIAYKLARRND